MTTAKRATAAQRGLHPRCTGAMVALIAAASFPGSIVNAQSLESRVGSAPPGRVQFTYAARPGVCGNGRSYIQTGPNSFSGDFYGNMDGLRMDPCVAGPVRVVLDRADNVVIAIKTFVGPPPATGEPGTADLGRVRAQDAADYLLALAAKAEGRAGRDAILPAMLADSVRSTPTLISIAKNQSLPRETRSSALSWLPRSVEDETTVPASVTAALLGIARDEGDNVQVRQQGLRTLSRLDHGAGVPPLVDLARSADHNWLQKESMSALARSGDPRARDFLRGVITQNNAPDDVLYTAIRGLGTEYATVRDAELLRQIYPKLTGERSKEAVLSSVAEMGGSENTRWLLGVAGNQSENINERRRALQNAARAGVPTAELVKLYDATTDPQMKEILIGIFAQNGDKAGTDKLITIAKSDESMTVRRRAISQLSRSEDPRVRDLLRDLIER